MLFRLIMLKTFMSYFILFIIIVLIILFVYLRGIFGILPSSQEIKEFEKLSYYKDGEFKSPKEIVYHFEKLPTSKLNMFLKFLSKSPNAPTENIPIVKPTFTEVPQDFALYWLGHSNAIIELNGKRMLIDPVFGNAGPLPFITPRYVDAPLTREELPNIDYILITHNHYDHLEKETVQSIKNGHFIVPLGIGSTLKGWGIESSRITELGWNENISNKDLSIIALPTIHYSNRGIGDKNKTLWVAYVIKSGDKNIFWSGDSGYGEHFAEYGNKYGPFDFAAIEIDGWNEAWPDIHLFPDQAVQAAIDLKTKHILPIHWGVFDLAMHPWHESIDMVIEEANKKNINVLTPKMGEEINDILRENKKWWIKNI